MHEAVSRKLVTSLDDELSRTADGQSRAAAAGRVKEGSAVNEDKRAHARCDAEIRIKGLRGQKARTNVGLGTHQ